MTIFVICVGSSLLSKATDVTHYKVQELNFCFAGQWVRLPVHWIVRVQSDNLVFI